MWTKVRENGTVTFLLIWQLDFFFNSQIVKRLLYLALSIEIDLGKSVELFVVSTVGVFLFACSCCFCFFVCLGGFFFPPHTHYEKWSIQSDVVFLQLPHWERRPSEPFLCPTHFVVDYQDLPFGIMITFLFILVLEEDQNHMKILKQM